MTRTASLASDLEDLRRAAAARDLAVLGGFHPDPGEPHLPAGTATVILLGPGGAGFWDRVTAAPEFADGRPDPLDRWSRRAVGGLACALGGKALFPFGGPPWLPFIAWAQRTGRARVSPVGLLVHAEAGLWFSVRGAVALRHRAAVPPPAPAPCESCAGRPCLTACPAGAMGAGGYDTGACHGHLDTAAGADCMDRGCAVRRACPVGRAYPRDPAQSAFHMRAFHGAP